MDSDVKAGVVKWFDEIKGFGFITPDGEDDTDVFVHFSVVPGPDGKKNLLIGDKVTYLEGTRGSGLYAIRVVTVVRS